MDFITLFFAVVITIIAVLVTYFSLKSQITTAQAVTGVPGAQGVKGDTGDKGSVGDAGAAGDKGLVGDAGAKGPVGDKGLVGDAGAKGPVGDKGLVGDAGAKGPVGDKGLVGDAGAKGPVGDKGIAGDKGLVGDKGPVGDKGVQGLQGTTSGFLPSLSKYSFLGGALDMPGNDLAGNPIDSKTCAESCDANPACGAFIIADDFQNGKGCFLKPYGAGTGYRATTRAYQAPKVATVYTDGNFGGSAINLKPGRYPAADFQKVVPNDSVSSVKVPAGVKLTLFVDDIGSTNVVFTADSSWVPNNGFPNDAASAALVELV
jgi:hypothetical protein